MHIAWAFEAAGRLQVVDRAVWMKWIKIVGNLIEIKTKLVEFALAGQNKQKNLKERQIWRVTYR